MKLVLQITGGILLAAILLVGVRFAVGVGIGIYATWQKDRAYEHMVDSVKIDCDKRYSVARIEAERIRRCE